MDFDEFKEMHNIAHEVSDFVADRFVEEEVDGYDAVKDYSSGLIWTKSLTMINHVVYSRAEFLVRDVLWRIPTLPELLTIIDFEHYRPALPYGLFKVKKDMIWYWTSTPYAGNEENDDHVWVINMESGHYDARTKYETHCLWPVKSF